jgi:hypothetical protein
MLGEHLTVDAGPMIEALGVPDRRQLHQVAIADVVPSEQNEVIVRAVALAGT